MAHDVFVSYSSKDKSTADAVCAVLEAHGIRCWIAPRDVTAGTEWGTSIVHAIGESRCMVLVFSDHANASPQVRREVERAVHKSIPIIPMRIQQVEPTDALEYFLSAPHWLDAFTPPLERHLQGLYETVSRLLGKPVRDSPAPLQISNSFRRTKAFRTALSAAALLGMALIGIGVTVWITHSGTETHVDNLPPAHYQPYSHPKYGYMLLVPTNYFTSISANDKGAILESDPEKLPLSNNQKIRLELTHLSSVDTQFLTSEFERLVAESNVLYRTYCVLYPDRLVVSGTYYGGTMFYIAYRKQEHETGKVFKITFPTSITEPMESVITQMYNSFAGERPNVSSRLVDGCKLLSTPSNPRP